MQSSFIKLLPVASMEDFRALPAGTLAELIDGRLFMSPSNAAHDLEVKKNLYEAFGVREYWIVAAQTGACLGYRLAGGKYKEPLQMKGMVQLAAIDDQVFGF